MPAPRKPDFQLPMPNYQIFSKATTANKWHGPCETCTKDILKGDRLVTIREFDPYTKSSGRVWKRHEGCPEVTSERARLSDARPGRNKS